MVSGIRCVVKAIENSKTTGVKVVLLANDCKDANLKNLISALAKTHGIGVCPKFSGAQLGEMAGQFHIKGHVTDGKISKVRNASCVAITSFGTLSES